MTGPSRTPTARELLNDLFAQLDESLTPKEGRDAITETVISPSTRPNPLSNAAGPTKSLLLTLHVVYPNELLPALDLLDRRLLTRLSTTARRTAGSEQTRVPETNTPRNVDDNGDETERQVEMSNEAAKDDIHASMGSADIASEASDTRNEDTITLPAPTTSHTQQIHHHQEKVPLYFVRSAQQPTRANTHTGGRFYDPLALTTHYEVRPTSWNCSCPAFAFAAFPAPLYTGARDGGTRHAEETRDTANLVEAYNASRMGAGKRGSGAEGERGVQISAERRLLKGLEANGGFGGLARLMTTNDQGNSKAGSLQLPPVCKHLLACAFVELCPSLQGFIEDKVVSKEEIAGWCAGWGD